MSSKNLFSASQTYSPIVGNAPPKSSIGYKATRVMASALNASQMLLAEAYINGLEIPDSVFRSMMDTSMSMLFQHAPGLLAPYEWVLNESDRILDFGCGWGCVPNYILQTIDRWYINGMNYHKTFTAWLERFDAAQDSIKLLDYQMDYAKFRRIWRFYLLMLASAFATCDGEYNGNGQYLLTRS